MEFTSLSQLESEALLCKCVIEKHDECHSLSERSREEPQLRCSQKSATIEGSKQLSRLMDRQVKAADC